VRATLHDELMREAGFEVASQEARERHRVQRRRWLMRLGAVFGLAAFGAIVAGLEFLRHGGRLSIRWLIVVALFAIGGLIWRILRDDEESQS
jgi:hypothetical protein